MIQEDKEQLILIDISARVPYDIMVEQTLFPPSLADKKQRLKAVLANNVVQLYWYKYTNEFVPIHCIKPYLRPMSSMTDEEKDTYDTLTKCNAPWVVTDWLNKNMFDYRNLIEKGLALKAPKGMYKIFYLPLQQK